MIHNRCDRASGVWHAFAFAALFSAIVHCDLQFSWHRSESVRTASRVPSDHTIVYETVIRGILRLVASNKKAAVVDPFPRLFSRTEDGLQYLRYIECRVLVRVRNDTFYRGSANCCFHHKQTDHDFLLLALPGELFAHLHLLAFRAPSRRDAQGVRVSFLCKRRF